MITEYRRELQHTWMILSGGSVPEEDAYPVRMLKENRIEGLLPCKIARMNGDLRFYYDISSRQSLKTMLETGPADAALLEMLFSSLAAALERLDEYLLDPDGLLLEPQYLYGIPETSELRFCWYPDREQSFPEQAQRLGKALLPHLDQADRAGVVMGYGFYQHTMEDALTPETLRALLRRREPEGERRRAMSREEPASTALLDAFFDEPEEASLFRGLAERIRQRFRRKEQKPVTEVQRAQNSSFGTAYGVQPEKSGGYVPVPGDISAAEETETVLLQGDVHAFLSPKTWTLVIREGTEETPFLLTAERYLVGKQEAGASLCLTSPAVSRLHAKLQKKGEQWYLSDLNSRNGTSAGKPGKTAPLLPEQERLLEDGDEIRFADVTCVFHEK